MTRFQSYVFLQCAQATLVIFAGLALIAFLTQALGQLDLIVEQRQSALTFLWITLLAMPQVLALIAPLAVFFGVVATLNRMQTDSEIAVAFGAGMSQWQLAAPVLRLAALVALAHLLINLFIQPVALREMRAQMFSIRSDLAATMVREGAFSHPAEGLTIFVRERRAGGLLDGVLVEDARKAADPIVYEAREGEIVRRGAGVAMVMREGSIQRLEADGALGLLRFSDYALDLSEFNKAEPELFLKPSDRFLWELFQPDFTHNWDRRNPGRLYAEGHGRIAAPLASLALAAIALAGLLGGEFSRKGYGRRIAVASGAALAALLLVLAAPGAVSDEPALNVLQYLIPAGVFFAAWRMFAGGRAKGGPETLIDMDAPARPRAYVRP
jgi:lipopolysaccharide export system permease protein